MKKFILLTTAIILAITIIGHQSKPTQAIAANQPTQTSRLSTDEEGQTIHIKSKSVVYIVEYRTLKHQQTIKVHGNATINTDHNRKRFIDIYTNGKAEVINGTQKYIIKAAK